MHESFTPPQVSPPRPCRWLAGLAVAAAAAWSSPAWAQTAASLSRGATGQADPIKYFADAAAASGDQKLKSAAAFVKAFSGILVLTGAQGLDLNQGQLFHVSGFIDLKSVGNAAVSAAGVAGAGTERKVFAGALRTMGGLGSQLGMKSSIPVVLTLSEGNAALDLALSFAVFDTWHITPALLPAPAETKLALQDFRFVLHAGKALTGAPTVSAEAAGDLFAQPTSRDPWLALKPSVSIADSGDLTFGGAISGACKGTPSKGANCDGQWNVLGLDLVRSKGGVLNLTVAGTVIKGVQAAIQGGKLGPTESVRVDGAMQVDTDLSPGGGMYLKTSGSPTLIDLMAAVSPFGYGLAKLAGIANKMPNAKLPISGYAEVVVAPTGLQLSQVNIPTSQPTFRYNVSGTLNGGATVDIKTEVTTDVAKLLAHDASGLPNGSIAYGITFADYTKKVKDALGPVLKDVLQRPLDTFEMRGASIAMGIAKNAPEAQGTLKFKLFGKDYTPTLSTDIVIDPLSKLTDIVKAELLGLKSRGVGKPLGCGSGMDYDAGLCYDECKAGFKGVGTTCSPSCPDGFNDIGISCEKPKGDRRESYPCPSGFRNDGLYCKKDTYQRGVGKVVDSCARGEEKDAGLCYPKCDAGFKAVGPMCWPT